MKFFQVSSIIVLFLVLFSGDVLANIAGNDNGAGSSKPQLCKCCAEINKVIMYNCLVRTDLVSVQCYMDCSSNIDENGKPGSYTYCGQTTAEATGCFSQPKFYDNGCETPTPVCDLDYHTLFTCNYFCGTPDVGCEIVCKYTDSRGN